MDPGYVEIGDYCSSENPLFTDSVTHCHVVGLESEDNYGIIHADKQGYRAEQVEFALTDMPDFEKAVLVTSPISYGNCVNGQKEGERTIDVLREFGFDSRLILEEGVKEVKVDEKGSRISGVEHQEPTASNTLSHPSTGPPTW